MKKIFIVGLKNLAGQFYFWVVYFLSTQME